MPPQLSVRLWALLAVMSLNLNTHTINPVQLHDNRGAIGELGAHTHKLTEAIPSYTNRSFCCYTQQGTDISVPVPKIY